MMQEYWKLVVFTITLCVLYLGLKSNDLSFFMNLSLNLAPMHIEEFVGEMDNQV